MSNKVMITGMGAISPIGVNFDQNIKNALDGVLGIRRAQCFDTELTGITCDGEAWDFDPSIYINNRESKRMAKFTQLALCAAIEAWENSKMEEGDYDRERVGVVLGSGMGGLSTICGQYDELITNGPRAVSSFFIPKAIINTAAGLIAMKLDIHGPCYCIVTACSSSADAVGDAYYAIKDGRADVVLAGGAESVINELAIQGFHQMGALSESADPKRASIPFDRDRQGFVMGEGAAFLVLESEEHAKKRGAKIQGELAGYAQTCDAYHITAPQPEGLWASKAIELVLKEGGIDKSQIGYINAHGTGTPLNDASESLAIEKAFGSHAKNLLVSSTKSMTGHLLGGAGAFESAITMGALNAGIAPPTIGLEVEGEGCNLDYVKYKAKKMDCEYAISNSFGFGGHNSCVLLRRA